MNVARDEDTPDEYEFVKNLEDERHMVDYDEWDVKIGVG